MVVKLNCGFTLLELMLTVALIAILAVIAIPTYQAYIINAKMKEAAQLMLKDAQFMEKYYTQNGQYTTATNGWPSLPYANSPESGKFLYQITISNSPDSSRYRLQGRPWCGTLVAASGCVCVDQDHNLYLAQSKLCLNSANDCNCISK